MSEIKPFGIVARVTLGLLACSAAAVRAQSPIAAVPLEVRPSGPTLFAQLPAGFTSPAAQAQARFNQGLAWEQAGQPLCVDAYYETAALSWQTMAAAARAGSQQPLPADAWVLYHDALARLIRTAPQHGRLDPRSGLRVNTPEGPRWVPARFSEFAWRPDDFHQLLVVGEYRSERPRQIFRRPGLGVPLVAVRRPGADERFLRGEHPFAATVVLRFGPPGPSPVPDAASLDFYDSHLVQHVPFAGGSLPLAADTTAPLALAISRLPPQRLCDRLQPGSSRDPPELFFLEPYRPGKIPIVLVHGLLSDPATWADLANDLRSLTWVNERYQIWAFRYPSVDPFLASAAALREQLRIAIAQLDPRGTQPALQHLVLVGHSMGGLVSKLQVGYGGPHFWNRFSSRPLESIVADPVTKSRLQSEFFFQPQPSVRRVVFIGTPHGGSSLASFWIGRIASALVKPSRELEQARLQLLQYNPGTFSPLVSRRFPNSIDLLEPESPLLAAMQQMPLHPQVRFHSIIGYGSSTLGGGDSDGVVPVSSARFPRAETETYVREQHTELHRNAKTFQTLLYILAIHYADYQCGQ